jgi:two-component system response regulator BaeR
MKHILVVEDEEKIAQLLIDYLHHDGHKTTHIKTGNAVVDWVKQHQPDLILLDLMLPEKDGLTICREIRAFSMIPIFMLTARVEEIDRLIGLEVGADDYICKPFSPREVIARIKSMFRRIEFLSQQQVDNPPVMALGLILDHQQYLATYNRNAVTLTPVEFKLLSQLAKHAGRVYTREHLVDCIYQDGRVVTDRTIDTHIKNIRKKLVLAGAEEELIQSIYGIGYKWMR